MNQHVYLPLNYRLDSYASPKIRILVSVEPDVEPGITFLPRLLSAMSFYMNMLFSMNAGSLMLPETPLQVAVVDGPFVFALSRRGNLPSGRG